MRLHLSKTLLQLILFIVFLLMYALPAVQRFLKHETIVLKSLKRTVKTIVLKRTGGIPAPSVTIAAYSTATKTGWKVTELIFGRNSGNGGCVNFLSAA